MPDVIKAIAKKQKETKDVSLATPETDVLVTNKYETTEPPYYYFYSKNSKEGEM